MDKDNLFSLDNGENSVDCLTALLRDGAQRMEALRFRVVLYTMRTVWKFVYG